LTANESSPDTAIPMGIELAKRILHSFLLGLKSKGLYNALGRTDGMERLVSLLDEHEMRDHLPHFSALRTCASILTAAYENTGRPEPATFFRKLSEQIPR
jgi:hypothetical protein